MSRLDRGVRKYRLEVGDLREAITDTVEIFRHSPEAAKFEIDVKLSLRPIEAKFDEGAIRQAILNLLSNAVKYSPNGGEIVVSSRVEGKLVHVCVEDHGLGIPADALEQVFAPYSRVESGTTRYIQGTGLGLPIVRQIVQMHGGKVWVESVLGQGSIFHFTLQLIDKPNRS